MRTLALFAARLLGKGKQYHLQYPNDAECGGSFLRKLLASAWLVLDDYAHGRFPPERPSHGAEENQVQAMTEWQAISETVQTYLHKPFRGLPTPWMTHYLRAFTILVETLDREGLKLGDRILELGCGMGWMTEMLAKRGYDMTGTTIAPIDIKFASTRMAAYPDLKMRFLRATMEHVSEQVEKNFYDAVFCFEALHHVKDWPDALRSAGECLKPGGRLLICEEPLWLHTFICHRSAPILKTRDIGFGSREIQRQLRRLGFTEIRTFRRPRFAPFMVIRHSLLAPRMWVTCRKPAV